MTLLISGKNHNQPLHLYMRGTPVVCLPIHVAASLFYWPGAVDIVKLLLNYGVDINARDSLGLTALDIVFANNIEYSDALEEWLHWKRDDETLYDIALLLANAGSCVTITGPKTQGKFEKHFGSFGDVEVLRNVAVLECESSHTFRGDRDNLNDSGGSPEPVAHGLFVGGHAVFPKRIWARRLGPIRRVGRWPDHDTPSPYISVPVSRGSSESVHSGDTWPSNRGSSYLEELSDREDIYDRDDSDDASSL